jgi:hypothetical protein
LRIESILEEGEHVIAHFSGGYHEGTKTREGVWYITNRRLVHTVPGGDVKRSRKKTIIGGVLFGGVGSATLGTKVEKPSAWFEDFKLNRLLSIEIERTNVIKMVFSKHASSESREVFTQVDSADDFIRQVKNQKKALEEEATKYHQAIVKARNQLKATGKREGRLNMKEKTSRIDNIYRNLHRTYSSDRSRNPVTSLERIKSGISAMQKQGKSKERAVVELSLLAGVKIPELQDLISKGFAKDKAISEFLKDEKLTISDESLSTTSV